MTKSVFVTPQSSSVLFSRALNLDDADHFLQGLLRREVTGKSLTLAHRDHQCSYLVQLFFWAGCCTLDQPVYEKKLARHLPFGKIDDHYAAFRDSWPFVSILHDV